ncbi:MAG: RrF2 family transcriptional regulator [Lachnospiraceae bacterium]
MRISAKSRYGLASMVFMATECMPDECITVIRISEKLNISKIYLEQVFSLLKRGGFVTSVKGPQGGYRLAKKTTEISVYDIFHSIESNLFEAVDKTVENESIEKAMIELVFLPLDVAVVNTLKQVTLEEFCEKVRDNNNNYMYYV